jgi:myo-inositol-1-phosphate synthase
MTENYYNYKYVNINNNNEFEIKEENIKITILEPKQSKLGVMFVGMGGNNGSTFVSSILAYQNNINWENKNGINDIDFFGSLYQYGNINIGFKNNKPYTKLIKDLINIKNPNEIIMSGWDICDDNMYEACKKNKVLDIDLLKKLENDLKNIKPLESVCYDSFIATNQKSRINNIKKSLDKWYDLLLIKSDIESFKIKHNLEKVIVMWTASTERFSKGKWNNINELLKSINENDPEISPSIIFAVASIMSGCIFINGSPQNTISPAILQLAKKYNTFVGGEDFKTGQTKLKSVLVDFLASSGIKPLSIVSYNHLGNNDGLNLDESAQFKSKEITKKNVIDDIVDENPSLFEDKKPDHCVVIKYIPAVGDSKRAMDEYYSKLFLDGRSNIVIHNTCEDTLLAVPLMLDIILFSEFFSRIKFSFNNEPDVSFSPNLSLLSFFFKAPIDDENPIINSFFKQRYGLENFIKACIGLPINDFINLHTRC